MPNVVFGDDSSNSLQGTAGADLIYGYNPNGPQSQASAIVATRVATGFSQPVFAGAPPGDPGRLFIVEKTGQIKILDLATGQALATPFLNVSGEILTDGERGLLGLAFDPGFANNGFFYVNLINTSGSTEIRRYHVSSNPNVAEASATPIITIAQPGASNHKAGWLGFGPDGYLYAALGDGGSTPGSAQDINSLLGKILRLDVQGDDDFPSDPTRNYAVPGDNPFVGSDGADEIFALGLRNPWRDSFDRGLGDLYIADVGQSQWEEIDVGQNGANYGWNAFEGPVPYPPGGPLTGGPAVAPIYSYDHTVGQSVTGGYVYRGEGEALQGQYFFADFMQSKVFTLRFDGSSWVATDRTSQITTDFGLAVNNPSAFGEDARGNLYVVDFGGEIFKLTPVVASADQADVLRGLGGDDLLFGGSGNDTLIGGLGADTLIGGPGMDTVDYSSSAAGVTVSLLTGVGSGGDAQGDILGGIENITGSSLADTLTGDSAANVLDGGPSGDTLFGGAGADQFVLRAPSQGVDTFADFSWAAGDRVVLDHTGFGLAGTGSLAAAGVNFVNGLTPQTAAPTILANSGDLYWDADGTGANPAVLLAHLNSSGSVVSVTNPGTNGWSMVATGDFNHDGITDVLWKNESSGMTSEWLMSPNGGLGSNPGTPGAAGWDVRATGDFNGDGTTDILWKNASSGVTSEWLMSANGGLGSNPGTPGAQGWDMVAAGDFNGDGTTDILWKNASSGITSEWLMSANGGLGANPGTPGAAGWDVIATADFNSDGAMDVMWRNVSTGATSEWFMSKTGGLATNPATPGTQGWNFLATGDFNGDGTNDLIWQNATTGATSEWLMSKNGGLATNPATPGAQGWNVIAVQDFNGDSIEDILWKNASTGATSEWLMSKNGGLGSNPGTPGAAGQDVVTTGDFNGDGTTDLIWRNATDGATTTSLFTHLTDQDFLIV